ncbi:MAG: DHH family phosphoesterase [Bacteroidales bacterium]|nr:DHH family phosphoesterase [Bacteroidales bacterium]MDD4670224.1 DHH family phosphoesterase [Bacteroidales bacterium]
MKIQINTAYLEEIISNCKNGLIVSHFNPDGDAVGSIVAFYYYLKGRDIDAKLVLPSGYPDFLSFLDPKEEKIKISFFQKKEVLSLIKSADTIFCLDFNKLSRTEDLEEEIRNSTAVKVLIDHHPVPEVEPFSMVISRTDVSSASELLFWTLMSMPDIAGNINNISIECAQALYVGMMTDTNNFSNSVFPSTFEMASELIGRGVDKNQLQEYVFNSYSYSRMKLMGHILKDNMYVLENQKAAYIILRDRDKKEYNFSPGDTEGFVNLPLSIKGIMVSALFTENINEETSFIRVSLRSKGDWNVNLFANGYFNGGGHTNASGGRLYDISIEKVPEYFEKAIKEYLKK